jgi:erythronate-4-phosphate dehydrogenase
VAHLVLDTWENEPAYRSDVLERADIGTPHIAGHPFEGKVMGTVMVYEAACRFLGKRPAWSHVPLMPPPPVPFVPCRSSAVSEEEALWSVVSAVYDVRDDDRRLRELPHGTEPARHFDGLRGNYPMRREFPCTRVQGASGNAVLASTLAALGFAVESAL